MALKVKVPAKYARHRPQSSRRDFVYEFALRCDIDPDELEELLLEIGSIPGVSISGSRLRLVVYCYPDGEHRVNLLFFNVNESVPKMYIAPRALYHELDDAARFPFEADDFIRYYVENVRLKTRPSDLTGSHRADISRVDIW